MRAFLIIVMACAGSGWAQGQPLSADRCANGMCPMTPGGASGVTSGVGQSPSELQVDARAIVRITNLQGTTRALGTGTLVDSDATRGWVITCAHLFREGTGQVTVTFSNGVTRAARVLKTDPAADLAVLEIAATSVPPIAIATNFAQRGDALVSCGYGSDGRLWCNRGQALGYVSTTGGHGVETLELTGSARMGDSGGPVLDREHRLVGVLFGTNGRVVDATFCGRVRHFLRGVSPRFSPPGHPQARELPGPADERPLMAVPPRNEVGSPRSGTTVKASAKPPAENAPREREAAPVGSKGVGVVIEAARPWISARLAALLISLGVPGGVAGLAAGAAVWLAMRRGQKRLQAKLDQLSNSPLSTSATHAEQAGGAGAIVERHHNRYVPYELSRLDKAWAKAHAQIGEKYPGAVPYLKLAEGLKERILSGLETNEVT